MQRINVGVRNNATQKGVTLIALVITIIVLLILAAISITTLFGSNGILTQANKVKIEYSHKTVKEAIELAYLEYQTELNTAVAGQAKLASTKIIRVAEVSVKDMTFMEYLQSKGYIDGDGVVNTINLVGDRLHLGNGTGTNDVYKVEVADEGYIVNYYDDNALDTEILVININTTNTISFTINYYDGDDMLLKTEVHKTEYGMTWYDWGLLQGFRHLFFYGPEDGSECYMGWCGDDDVETYLMDTYPDDVIRAGGVYHAYPPSDE